MAIEAVKEYLKAFGAEDRVIELEESSATVALAAEALGVAEKRIAKTLSFEASEGAILVVAAGDARVVSSKFKKTFSLKPKMLKYEDAETVVGHAPGGVCPFAVKEGVSVWLDESLKRFDTVFPACGSSNSAIELTCNELERFSNAAGWVDVCKLPEA